MICKKPATTTVAAFALFAISSTTTFAASEQEITDALTKLIQGGDAGVTVTLGTPTADGDALVYKDVAIKSAGETASDTKIGTLTVTGGDVNDMGGIKAGAIKAEAIESTDGSTKATVASAEIVNPDIAAPPAEGKPGRGKFDSVTVSDIAVSESGKPPVTIATVGMEATDYVGDYPRAFSLSVENVVVDPAVADDGGQFAGQLKELGYEKVDANVYISGSWDQDAGTLSIEDFSIEGADMGSIGLSAVLGGFTADVMAQLGQPNPPPELMNSVTVNEAQLTYEDSSLAGRLLDMQAKQMGASRENFVNQISAALPLMLSALQNPGFQDKLATAAGTFLKDPKNITISAQPEKPVTVMELMTTAQTAPQTLPDQLKAEVTANEELEQ
jgi:hypothetical protein